MDIPISPPLHIIINALIQRIRCWVFHCNLGAHALQSLLLHVGALCLPGDYPAHLARVGILHTSGHLQSHTSGFQERAAGRAVARPLLIHPPRGILSENHSKDCLLPVPARLPHTTFQSRLLSL